MNRKKLDKGYLVLELVLYITIVLILFKVSYPKFQLIYKLGEKLEVLALKKDIEYISLVAAKTGSSSQVILDKDSYRLLKFDFDLRELRVIKSKKFKYIKLYSYPEKIFFLKSTQPKKRYDDFSLTILIKDYKDKISYKITICPITGRVWLKNI